MLGEGNAIAARVREALFAPLGETDRRALQRILTRLQAPV
jgi:hypothetical protein